MFFVSFCSHQDIRHVEQRSTSLQSLGRWANIPARQHCKSLTTFSVYKYSTEFPIVILSMQPLEKYTTLLRLRWLAVAIMTRYRETSLSPSAATISCTLVGSSFEIPLTNDLCSCTFSTSTNCVCENPLTRSHLKSHPHRYPRSLC